MMKNIVIGLLMMAIVIGCTTVKAEDLRLTLESAMRAPRLGDTATFQLKIVGDGVSAITKGTEGITRDFGSMPEFVHTFKIQPKRTGKLTFGPYSMVINGQRLTSNSLIIDVLPEWPGAYETVFRVDRDSVLLGENFALIVETWFIEPVERSFQLDRKDSFTVISSGSGSSHRSGPNGKINCHYQSWVICPKHAGEFKITKELFREFAADVKSPSLSVIVKELAQPAGADRMQPPQP